MLWNSGFFFVAKKAGRGTELQFLCTQGTLQGGRVEDHRLMSPQLYIQYTLYTLHQYAHSPYCSPYISWFAGKENLFNNQEVPQFIIIAFILITLTFDSGAILRGEISHYQGLKGKRKQVIKKIITLTQASIWISE